MKKNVLIIGGTGYIGSEVILYLLNSEDYNLIAFSCHKNDKCLSYTGNVLQIEDLEKIYSANEIDVTLILYGLRSIADSIDVCNYSTNEITGMINILNSCEKYGCKNVVYLSSSAVYASGYSLTEESEIGIKSFYSFVKHTNENLLKWYKKYKNIDYCVLRCFNVSGCSEKGVKPRDIMTISLQNNSLCIFGSDFNTPDGTLIRDYVHVKDVAVAVGKTINYEGSGIFNIGSGIGYSVKEIIKHIEKLTNKHIQISYAEKREFDQDCLIADISKARALLNWTPQYNINAIIESVIKFSSCGENKNELQLYQMC